MKKLKHLSSLIIPAFLFSLSGWATQYVVLSDIDDTVRITNVQSYWETFKNALFKKDIFLGIPSLYQSVRENCDGVIYLSAGPQCLRDDLEKTLEEVGLPLGPIHLRNWMSGLSAAKFKESLINELIDQTKSSFLVIADDTESDPFIFSDFRKRHPDRFIEIYIHRVKGIDLPEGVIGYSNPFDIAVREVNAGRLDSRNAVEVAHTILGQNRFDLLYPWFKMCPRDYSPPC